MPNVNRIAIGGRTFDVGGNVPSGIPAQVRKFIEIAEKMPDGKLLTTAQMSSLAGYSRRIDSVVPHPACQPYVFRYSYNVYLWGNRKEIAYAKKATKSSTDV
jgi:hypothetical protein